MATTIDTRGLTLSMCKSEVYYHHDCGCREAQFWGAETGGKMPVYWKLEEACLTHRANEGRNSALELVKVPW